MKKTYITAALIVSFCLIITIVTRTAAKNFSETEPVSETEETTVATAPEAETLPTEKIYLLTEKDGRIAVYAQGADEPFRITDTYLRDLPEFDREKIRIGIEIHGDTALRRALEDYCS